MRCVEPSSYYAREFVSEWVSNLLETYSANVNLYQHSLQKVDASIYAEWENRLLWKFGNYQTSFTLPVNYYDLLTCLCKNLHHNLRKKVFFSVHYLFKLLDWISIAKVVVNYVHIYLLQVDSVESLIKFNTEDHVWMSLRALALVTASVCACALF
jgi:hypothetical protein